ncbi:MAG: Crp/Fnr family transcriptional regulator [Oscillospiraceae bacterium]|nr:Crp/Fnr family transcriptional regulator [Oscillospiraceae bacterium]
MEFSECFAVWNKLTPGQQQTLHSSVSLRTAQKGEIIHNGNLTCTGLLLVKTGQLRAYYLSDEGREITLYRLFEMDLCLFSAFCIMNSIQFDVVIQAEKETQYWLIPPFVYKGIMEESAPLANYTNEVMAARFSDVMWLMEQVMWKSFDKRLAAFLLEEAALEGTNVLKLTHEAIGNHMGNPREVVTRMLRYFQSEGLIKLSRGTVEILDEKGLRLLQKN